MTVVFNTNAGSSKRYADMLAEKLGCNCVSLAKSRTLPADEEIVFIGWVMANTLQGYSEVKEKFNNIRCVCAVGISTGEKAEKDIKEKNQLTQELFILPGAFNIDKLNGMYKMLMKMALSAMKNQLKDKDGENNEKMMAAFEKGVDLVSEEHLDAVIEFLK